MNELTREKNCVENDFSVKFYFSLPTGNELISG